MNKKNYRLERLTGKAEGHFTYFSKVFSQHTKTKPTKTQNQARRNAVFWVVSQSAIFLTFSLFISLRSLFFL